MKIYFKLQSSILNKIYLPIMVLVFSLGILASPIFGQQINISSGAYFNNSGSTYIVVNNGNFVNNGTFNKDTETVIFSGNTARTISGNSNTDMYNLSVTNTGGITTELNQLTVSDLTIASSCKFTIASAKSVEVSGTLTNNASTGGLFLKSDATGTASLIHNTNSVPATVERYISGSAEDWHFLSSPISNQSISGTWLPTGTYGNLTGYDLYLWNEPNNCWIYLLDVTSAINWGTVHPGSDFETGRGYLYSVQATNPTNEFVGNLNNGTLDYSVAFSGAEVSLKGFNLVGNPYPSSIDWEATTGWDRYNLISSGGGYDMWIWNPAANNYGVCNSFTGIVTNGVTRYIAPMQGFFVRAASSGNITFDNNARVQNGASAWMKGKVQEENSLSLSVSSKAGFGSDEILLRFGYLSNESGSMKLFSRELSAPSLFMSYKSDFLSVRYLTNTNENTMVPLMFTPGVRGDFSITCNFELNNFEIVRLEDRKTHIIHDMKVKNTYSFHSTTSDSPNRFVLYFGPIDSNFYNEFPARIYTDGFQLVVDLTLVGKETDIVVYDLMGRLLLHQKLQGESQHKLNLNADTQIIVVSLRNPDGSLNQKVFWLRK